ncbi:MAG: hypothetical protein R2873_30670 [Caldilineaceae bacterium]
MGVVILLSTIWTMNSLEILPCSPGRPQQQDRSLPTAHLPSGHAEFSPAEGAAVLILMLPVIGLLIFFVARYLEREAIS